METTMPRKKTDHSRRAPASTTQAAAADPAGEAPKLTMDAIQRVPLDALREAAEAPSVVGIPAVRRQLAGDASDAELEASIRAHGLINPLLVVSGAPSGALYVIAGNRRLAALRAIHKGKEQLCDVPVLTLPLAAWTPDQLREVALADNVVRAPMHPIDRFEAFSAMARSGMKPEDIAARFGLTRRAVDQALALGALAGPLRDAWRAGKITAEAAQVYTLEPDHAQQVKLFKRFGVNTWQVRNTIVGERKDVAHLVKFVGEESYLAAGGKVIRDLFSNHDIYPDAEAAIALARARLEGEAERLKKKEGWKWCAPADGLPNDWRYKWPREGKKGGTWSEAAKKRSGCVLEVDRDGKLSVERGVVDGLEAQQREKAAKAKKRAKDAAAAGLPEPDKAVISNALAERLSRQLTAAAAKAITSNFDVALAAAIAALSCWNDWHKPVKLRSDGLVKPDLDDRNHFAQLLQDNLKLGQVVLLERFSKVIAGTLDMTVHKADQLPLSTSAAQVAELAEEPNGAKALLDALDMRELDQAVRDNFDAGDYFASVSKEACLDAIEEAVSAEQRRRLAGKPKKDVSFFAAAEVPKHGWLPPALRTRGYAGPGARPAAVDAPAEREAKRKP